MGESWESKVERGAKAAYEENRRRCNEVLDPALHLDPWEEEHDGLRDDWRAFFSVGLKAVLGGQA